MIFRAIYDELAAYRKHTTLFSSRLGGGSQQATKLISERAQLPPAPPADEGGTVGEAPPEAEKLRNFALLGPLKNGLKMHVQRVYVDFTGV